MPGNQHFTQLLIEINGRKMPPEFMDALVEIVVDTSLHLPNMFTIRIHDPQLIWVEKIELFDVGKQVTLKVETGQEQGNLSGLLIKGEITALEPTFSVDGRSMLLIRGYDQSHRLHRGRQTRTFANQSISQIVRHIAEEVGLSAEVDPIQVEYDYVLQNNQTNMEFLLERAERIGYLVYAVDGKLYFKQGEANQGDGPELALGETLYNFQTRLITAHQADRITVKGWDAKGKIPIVSEATPNGHLNQGGQNQTGGDIAKSAFNEAEAAIVSQPVFTVAEAEALATRLSHDISREFIQAEGVCRGDPRIKAGWMIIIKAVGTRFSGKYFVTSATHIYNERGYETRFSISGRRPQTMSGLLNQDNNSSQNRNLMQGVVTGLVTNHSDPENLGRVKVKYGWLGEIESDWIRIAAPIAGAGRGFFSLPEVNDEVLIAFEQGDIHHPYIIGVLWNRKDRPPKRNQDVVGGGKVNQRILKSRSGHQIILDDTAGQEQIKVVDGSGTNIIILNSRSIELQGGGRKVTMQNGQIHMT